MSLFFQFSSTADEWKTIAKEFEDKWQFPNCLGSVDGKHVKIVPPAGSGSYYYNYKGSHSLVLLAVANANYEFIMCDFGTNGRISDGGVIENTAFYDKLIHGKLQILAPTKVGNSERTLNYVFIGDEAFALRPDFIKPYCQRDLTDERRIYNYRLSRARRIIENSFGILASRFRIFHTSINISLEDIDSVVMACCVLHNFLRKKCSQSYTPSDCFDSEDTEIGSITQGNRTDNSNLINLRSGHYTHISNDAKEVRQEFTDYFCNEGSVPWQNKMCNL